MENELDEAPRTLCEGMLGSEPIRGEGRNGPIEEFEAKLIEHYPGNIDETEDEFLSLIAGKGETWIRTCCASPPPSALQTYGMSPGVETRRRYPQSQIFTSMARGSGRTQEQV